jgi:hypothetical protein
MRQGEKPDYYERAEHFDGSYRPCQPMTCPAPRRSACVEGPELGSHCEPGLASQSKSGDRALGVTALDQQRSEIHMCTREPAITGAPVRRDRSVAVANLLQDLTEFKRGRGVTQLVSHCKRSPGGLGIAATRVETTELVRGRRVPAFGRDTVCLDRATRIPGLLKKGAQCEPGGHMAAAHGTLKRGDRAAPVATLRQELAKIECTSGRTGFIRFAKCSLGAGRVAAARSLNPASI